MNDKASRNRQLGAVFLSLFLCVLGFSILFPVLGPLGRSLGFADWQIGWMSTSYAFAQFLFAPHWGRVSERSGRKAMMLLGVFGFGLGFSGLAVVLELAHRHILSGMPLLAALLCTRALGGALSAAALPATQAHLADITNDETRTRGMAVLGSAFGLALITGPLLGGLAVYLTGRLEAPVWCSLGLFVFTYFVTSWVIVDAPRKPIVRDASSTLVKKLTPLLALAFAISVSMVAVEQTMALLMQDRLHTSFTQAARDVAIALAAYGFVAVITQGGLARRVKLRPTTLLLIGMPISILGLALLKFDAGFSGILACFALQGLGSGLSSPGVSSLTFSLAGDGEYGPAAGLASSAQSLGRVLGPVLGTTLYAWSPTALHGFTVFAMCVAYAMFWRQKRSGVYGH